ncbi:MAG: hypothetical protein KKD18_04980, partial [Nanoarchaeota archaeon]|nr:hypothetical protein [Nanoarchaeota archaeon]
WREIDLENEQIEKGLKVKFDASVSSGNPARYYWDWGDGTYGSGLTDIHQYSQQRIVTLSIYTADWSQWGTIQKTIHVNSGMQPVFNGILNTYPSPSYVNGNDFWYYVLGTSGYKLGHLNLSSVYNTKEEYSLPYGPYSVYDFDANSNYLFTIRNNDNYNPPMRLDVRVADIANPELITFYTSEDFGLSGLHQVAAVGNYLYIGSYSDNELKVYDFSNPQSPQFVSSLTVPYGNGIDKLEKIGDKALALLTYNYPNPNRALIIDIKNPTDLHIVEMPSIEALNKVSVMAETTAAFYNYSTWKMVELNIPQQVSEPITISDIWDFSIGEPYGQNGQRLYGTGGSYCAKYDITDKDNAYQMDQSYCGDLGMNGILAAFLHDPDSEGPEEPHFYAVGSSGSYRVLDLGEN